VSSKVFLVPTVELGKTADVMPEKISRGAGDWVDHTRAVLERKRKAARERRWQPSQEIGEHQAHLAPATADHCPAMAELESIGLVLKWPVTAILRQATPSGWEVKPSSNFNFLRYSPRTSFPEAGEAEAIEIHTGWTVVTPPGWSVLVKSLPNDFAGPAKHLVIAEGIVRADSATIPLVVQAWLRGAPKEIKIKRGDPLVAIFPFRREGIEYGIADDKESVEEAARLSSLDRAAFENGAGVYKRLYVEAGDPSPLYPKLLEKHGKE
jgi:hypothetical protein